MSDTACARIGAAGRLSHRASEVLQPRRAEAKAGQRTGGPIRRRYLFGAITLSLAGAVAALTLSAAAGAEPARLAIACAHPTKITPTHGGPGTRVTVYTKNADLVTSMWMRRKGDDFNPPNSLFDAVMKGLQHGDGWVSARFRPV